MANRPGPIFNEYDHLIVPDPVAAMPVDLTHPPLVTIPYRGLAQPFGHGKSHTTLIRHLIIKMEGIPLKVAALSE